ncbi:hypothetical protein M501DRAFT_936348 [Patellaria atrata CBS 101060]|uniref:Uncharacterized protein n=1 Tax=Patellaria atrata CBS 101060 TaxID=1346257 RepID=A0A9P4S929_9PEZI|nr:hypothetical protein M501DRAFT_936348 [Patellaria atrata CBS 101060]
MVGSSSNSIRPTALSIELSQHSTSPPTLRATVRNNHSKILTILTWDTPLDEKAAILGVFRVTEKSSGDEVEMGGIKINRLLPPPRDAFVELSPGAESSKDFELKEPLWPMEKGHRYYIKAVGDWKAVWEARVGDLTDGDFKDMAASERAIKIETYESEPIEVEI